MKIDDILKLKEQGFTAQEIVSLGSILDKDNAPVSAPVQSAPVEPTKEVEPIVDPVMKVVSAPIVEKEVAEPVVATASNADPMQEILNQLANLTKAIQAGSIVNDRQPIVTSESATDALASIL